MVSDIINFLRKSNAERAIIDRLIQALHEQQPEIKGDPKTVKVALDSEVRRKTSSVTTSIGSPGVLSETRDKEAVIPHKNIPLAVKSHELTQVFETMDSTSYQAQGHKFGGNGFGGGGSRSLNIPNVATLNFTDKVTVSLWAYVTNTRAQDTSMVQKGTDGSPQWGFKTSTSTTLWDWRIRDSTPANNSITETLDLNQWTHLVGSFDGGGTNNSKFWKNGTEVSGSPLNISDGAMEAQTTDIGIFERAGGGFHMGDDTRIAHLWIGNTFVDDTWVTDAFNGKITSKGRNEILYIPFDDLNWVLVPDGTSGLCQSST